MQQRLRAQKTPRVGDIPQRRRGQQSEGFYYCDWVVIACSSMTGGCPNHDVCITGAKPTVAIDLYRTESLPTRGGLEFSCPFHDEDS